MLATFEAEVMHIKVSFHSKCSTRGFILTFLEVVLYRVESFLALALGAFVEVEFDLLGVVLVLETCLLCFLDFLACTITSCIVLAAWENVSECKSSL